MRSRLGELEEIKLRPEGKLRDDDLAFKVEHMRRLLESGSRVRLVVVFRGPEIAHPETGTNVLDRVVALCSDVAVVEAMPTMDGRRMIMTIAPKPVST